MLRKMKFVQAIAALALLSSSSAMATTLTLDAFGTYVQTAPYNLTELGTLDWSMPLFGEKAGGTAISTYTNSTYPHLLDPGSTINPDARLPIFSFTDGEGDLSTPGTKAYENCKNGGLTSTIAIPAGEGYIKTWMWSWTDDGTFSATFDDSTTVSAAIAPGVTPYEAVLHYSTATAQTISLTVSDDVGGSFFAMAVSEVPEPGTIVLLSSGLIGLLCYAWKKRK